MRALFFGTSAFALPSLRALVDADVLAGVVTQPDRPAGRGHRLTPSPIKAAAATLGVPVYEPTRLRDFDDVIAADDYDLFALVSYGRILPGALLEVPRLGALNVHPSLLPAYRGATPIQSALRDGAIQTGVSLMLMDVGMDTGDIVFAQPVNIEPTDTYGALHDRLASVGAQLLARAIDLARTGALPHAPQTGESSVTKPIHKGDLQIDWQWSAMRIVNHIRAYAPQPTARASLEGEIVKIRRGSIAATAHVDAPPGSVLGLHGDGVLVACSDGAVVVEELIASNRPRESGAEYIRRRREATISR